MDAKRLDQLRADTQTRVQGSSGVLRQVSDPSPPERMQLATARSQEIDAGKSDLAGAVRALDWISGERQGKGALAATRLTGEPQRPASMQIQLNAADDEAATAPPGCECNRHIGCAQDVVRGVHGSRVPVSSLVRASASRCVPMTTTAIAAAGASAISGACCMYSWPSATISPQFGFGG